MKKSMFAAIAFSASFACSAQVPPAGQPAPDPPASKYIADREALLAPSLTLLAKGDYDSALVSLHAALLQYPHDARVLTLTGNAEKNLSHFAQAAADYEEALRQTDNDPWRTRISLIQTYAALQRWDDFDRERQLLRDAKKAGNPQVMPINGYVIEDLKIGEQPVRVVEYPSLAGRYNTRYRFFLLRPGAPKDAFTPYIDLESDSVDQVQFKLQHPDKAAAGDRSFSLDSYPTPQSQGLIKFYWEGEPRYEDVRSDVIATQSAHPPAH